MGEEHIENKHNDNDNSSSSRQKQLQSTTTPNEYENDIEIMEIKVNAVNNGDNETVPAMGKMEVMNSVDSNDPSIDSIKDNVLNTPIDTGMAEAQNLVIDSNDSESP